jgi:hypothetical protein
MNSGTFLGTRTCCAVRLDLANKFAISARLYAEAVVILTSVVTSGSNYADLRMTARRAQEHAEEARVAFEEHVAGHGC